MNHDIFGCRLSVYSTQHGVWSRCERLGMRLDFEDGGGRSYSGPAGDFYVQVRRRRRTRTASKSPVVPPRSLPGEKDGQQVPRHG